VFAFVQGATAAIRGRVERLLAAVGLAPYMADRWPGQLSGGEKQRVALARGLALSPLVMLLDEPLSSLDVSVQAALLNTLASLQLRDATAYVIISHDLSVVVWLADTVVVLYLGQVVEAGRAADVMSAPQHPYTEALLSAVPVPDPAAPGNPIRLHGDPPSPVDIPSGCPFHPRCPRYAGDQCRAQAPPWQVAPQGKAVRCHIPLEDLRAAQEGGAPGPRP